MSRMWIKRECQEWIDAARVAGWDRLPKTKTFSIHATAIEQRANLEGLETSRRHSGRVPDWCDLNEYRECVEMLEAAAGMPEWMPVASIEFDDIAADLKIFVHQNWGLGTDEIIRRAESHFKQPCADRIRDAIKSKMVVR